MPLYSHLPSSHLLGSNLLWIPLHFSLCSNKHLSVLLYLFLNKLIKAHFSAFFHLGLHYRYKFNMLRPNSFKFKFLYLTIFHTLIYYNFWNPFHIDRCLGIASTHVLFFLHWVPESETENILGDLQNQYTLEHNIIYWLLQKIENKGYNNNTNNLKNMSHHHFYIVLYSY